jgi:hypothetical protein
MKSFIKVYGPPLFKALKALEKVAIDLPEVCIMDHTIAASVGLPGSGFDDATTSDTTMDSMGGIMTFFGGPSAISEERCDSIISKSGESLGVYDFYYEWFKVPSMAEINSLIEMIDEALAPIGVKYTITTK